MDNNWKLENIELKLERFGENKGKYVGKVQFQNDEYDYFSFRIRPDMAQPYINLISEEIVRSATELGQKLLVSLGLKDE